MGVTGVLRATYYISGQQEQSSTSSHIAGYFQGGFRRRDDVALSVWSPCGGDAALNVNLEVALLSNNDAARGVLAATRESGRFSSLYVQWKKC